MKQIKVSYILVVLILGGLLIFGAAQYLSDKNTAEIAKTEAPLDETEEAPNKPIGLDLVELSTALTAPTDIANTGIDGDERLFIVERSGRVLIYENGQISPTPFLDISEQVIDNREQGLLGLAFHTEYSDNGLLYVNAVTPAEGGGSQSVVLEFNVASDGDSVEPSSQREVIRYDQPFSNHNGGDLVFDSTGNLYIATGDGGDGGDPQDNAQNLDNLLGAILRIEPTSTTGSNYSIPSDNPFVNDPEIRDEIWAYGLRNPWRISIDQETQQMYIGDVGQSKFEEIDRLNLSDGGKNFGWRCFEGNESYNPEKCGPADSYEKPLYTYGHEGSSCTGSVTGGFVYRGADHPNMQGLYIFADYCKGRIYAVNPSSLDDQIEIVNTDARSISSFGEDINKELYAVSITSSGGVLYRETPK